MTHPGRIRRRHTAQHRSNPRRRADHPGQRPEPDRIAATSPDHSPAASGESAGRFLGRRPRRGIARPARSDSSGGFTTPPASPAGTTRDAASARPLLYTAEQAAALLQVRPSWLRRKAAARAVPCRFVGKHLRFSHTDIETIAEGNSLPHQQSA